MTPILFRYDDYSAISNADIERRIFDAVAKRGIRLSVAIVPFVAGMEWQLRGPIPLFPLSAEKIALFKEFSAYLEPVLHGYAHQTVSRYSGLSEFNHAIPFDIQLARLQDGKSYLEDTLGVKITTFVPPWNAYTDVTLDALKKTGFEAISGDALFGPLCAELAYIPSTCSLSEMQNSLAAAKEDPSAFINVLFHEYDFMESRSQQASITIEEFEHILDRTVLQDVKFTNFSDCLTGFDMQRAKANQELRDALQSPFRKLMKRGNRGVYWSSDVANRKARLLSFFNCVGT
jgi:hypothetical protein